MIGDLIKKLVPIGIGAAAATVGASAIGAIVVTISKTFPHSISRTEMGF